VDHRARRVSRQVRRFRRVLFTPQAGPEAAPAHSHRR
jgi:hypothetical protein